MFFLQKQRSAGCSPGPGADLPPPQVLPADRGGQRTKSPLTRAGPRLGPGLCSVVPELQWLSGVVLTRLHVGGLPLTLQEEVTAGKYLGELPYSRIRIATLPSSVGGRVTQPSWTPQGALEELL